MKTVLGSAMKWILWCEFNNESRYCNDMKCGICVRKCNWICHKHNMEMSCVNQFLGIPKNEQKHGSTLWFRRGFIAGTLKHQPFFYMSQNYRFCDVSTNLCGAQLYSRRRILSKCTSWLNSSLGIYETERQAMLVALWFRWIKVLFLFIFY